MLCRGNTLRSITYILRTTVICPSGSAMCHCPFQGSVGEYALETERMNTISEPAQ